MSSLRRTACVLAVAGAPLGSLIGAAAAHAGPESPPAPNVTSPKCSAEPCYIDQSQPHIAVSGVKPGATVYLAESGHEGTPLAEATSGTETATLVPSSPLHDGYHTLVITQTASGKTSPPSSIDLDIETGAPTLYANVEGVTNNAMPTLFGRWLELAYSELNEHAGVRLIDADTGETLGEAKYPGNEEQPTWQPSTPLHDGSYSVYAVAIDDAGNVGIAHSNTVSFTVDTVPPVTPTVTSPANGSSVATSMPAITTTGNKAGDIVCADIDAETASEQVLCQVADANGNTAATPERPLGNGRHTLSVWAYDEAGNVSGTGTTTFTVNAGTAVTAPPAPVFAPAAPAAPPATPKLLGLAGKTLTLTPAHPVKIGIAVSGPGTVTLTLTKKSHGKTKVVGTVTLKVTKAGKKSYTLATKFAGHALAKGSYTLTLQSLSGGQHSGTVSVPVKVGGKG
jgi:hypothetical protein